MKKLLRAHLAQALKTLGIANENCPHPNPPPQAGEGEFIHIERSRDDKNGDFASNVALSLAKLTKSNPRALAQSIIDALPKDSFISKIEIAGPGFINFFLSEHAFLSVIKDVLFLKAQYGKSNIGVGTKIHIEFVSSNPTGPLHVGHGRGAAYGASVSNLLETVGFFVHREYYVNDAGRQMDILATSVWLRYLQLHGEHFAFPTNGYKGDYVKNIAEKLTAQASKKFCRELNHVFANVPQDEVIEGQGDKEAHIDVLIFNAKTLLGTDYRIVFDLALNDILADIREDLKEYGVEYDRWFSERSLIDTGAVERALHVLREKHYAYEQEGAWWFKSTEFGDDKDRVLVRANGEKTYFANDIAYHLNKLECGFDKVIDVLGSDHHGYIPRMRAVMQALAGRADALVVPLLQFVTLYRGTEKVSMSTRSGEFITLRELREEIGNDAARFFYVMRKADQHMDFDLELAKSKSNDNPVYYIQYAYARVCSVFRQVDEKKIVWKQDHLEQLVEPQERELMKALSRYPEVIEAAALNYDPHMLANYLRELAAIFHNYYNVHSFLVDDEPLRNARLTLISAVQQVILNGLTLLGVSAPDKM